MTATQAAAEQRAIVRPERVVGELLRVHAHVMPQARFLTCDEHELAFGALDVRSDEVAAGLSAAGVTRGDRVAIVCLNRIEMLELFFGVAKLGAIQVPLNAFLKGEFLRYQLADCRASTLIVDAAGLDAVAPMLSTLEELRLLVTLDAHPPVQVPSAVRVCSYAEVTAARLGAGPGDAGGAGGSDVDRLHVGHDRSAQGLHAQPWLLHACGSGERRHQRGGRPMMCCGRRCRCFTARRG